MATKLTGLELDRVDFVDKGANPGAFITLFKRDGPMDKDVLVKPEATEAQIAELQKRASDAEKVAKEATDQAKQAAERIAKLESDQRELVEKSEAAEFVAKAQGYRAIAKPDEFAPVLRKIHKTLDEAQRTWFTKWLDSVAEIAKQSALFRELGVGGSPEAGTAYDKLEKMARDRMAKGESKETFEQAFAAVCESESGKRLYDEYLKETN